MIHYLNKFVPFILFVVCTWKAPIFANHFPLKIDVLTEEGLPWAKKCVELYPEILWLADRNVLKTEDGVASLQGTYSEQIFGQRFVEFDRTLMTIHCLKLILDGSDSAYQTFTDSQPKETKLSRESFQTLHLQGQKLLKSNWEGMSPIEIVQTMETALVLGDMGKSEKTRKLFKPYGVNAPDHDDFYGEAMQVMSLHPELSPSFDKLSQSGKKLLAQIANLAHYGHITHLEGGPNMFTKLKESEIVTKNPFALSFDLFIHACDVAGAFGHVNNRSSLVYTQPTHDAIQAINEVLATCHNDELEVYNAYLAMRALKLGLNPHNSTDRVLTRIGAMLRLFAKEDGVILRKAMTKLDPVVEKQVAKTFDIQLNQTGRTPTYMPAFLVNLSNNLELGNTKEERLNKAVSIGLSFITKILEQHKELVSKGEMDPNIPLNFNKMAAVAKSDPDSLKKDCTIDQEGNVLLASESNN